MTPREEQQAFYENLARAITQWAHVEHGLFTVFYRVIGASDTAAASAAFFAVMNFNAKLDMTNGAAQFALADSPFLELWDKIEGRCEKRVRKRNELAHFNVLNQDGPVGKRLILRPHLFDAMNIIRYKNKKMPELGYKELAERSRSFGRLSQDLMELGEQIPWQLPSHRKSRRQDHPK